VSTTTATRKTLKPKAKAPGPIPTSRELWDATTIADQRRLCARASGAKRYRHPILAELGACTGARLYCSFYPTMQEAIQRCTVHAWMEWLAAMAPITFDARESYVDATCALYVKARDSEITGRQHTAALRKLTLRALGSRTP